MTQNLEYRQKVAGTMVFDSKSILLPLSIESVAIKVATVSISDFVMPYVNDNDLIKCAWCGCALIIQNFCKYSIYFSFK